MNDAEAAYKELESLLDFLKAFAEAKANLLHEAYVALRGDSGNPALSTPLQAICVTCERASSELKSQLK